MRGQRASSSYNRQTDRPASDSSARQINDNSSCGAPPKDLESSTQRREAWESFLHRNKVERAMFYHLTEAMQRVEHSNFICKKCTTFVFSTEQVMWHGLRSSKTGQT